MTDDEINDYLQNLTTSDPDVPASTAAPTSGMSDDDIYNYLYGASAGNNDYDTPGATEADVKQSIATDVKNGTLTQKGDAIFDKLGNKIAQLAADGTIGTLTNLASAYMGYQQYDTNSDLAKSLQGTATTALTNFANQVAGMNSPDLLQYVNSIKYAVDQGKITPAQAMATLQDKSNLAGIKVPDSYNNAVNSTLTQLGQVAQQGYTPVERAATEKILQQMNEKNMGDQAAIKSDLASRGQYGVGSELAARLAATQANANLASQQGLDVESAAAQRALTALNNQGALGLQAGQQSFNQQQAQATAQDAINQFNSQMQTQISSQNAANQQQASMQDKANQMAVQQQNLTQSNTLQANQLAAAQAQYQAQLDKTKLQQQALTSAASNATNMWTAPYKQAQAGQQALAQSVANAGTTKTPTSGAVNGTTNTNGPSTVQQAGQAASSIGSIVNAGKSLWDLFSDERVKDDIKPASDDEIWDVLGKLAPISFSYNEKAVGRGAPTGKVIGISAQDMEKSKGGRDIVHDSNGIKALDGDKALSLALAALSSLNTRLNDIEDK